MNFSQFFVLPVAEPRPIVRVTGAGSYDVVAELPCSLREQVRIQDARRATVISEEHDRIDVYEWMVGALGKTASLPLPPDMYATDVLLKGGVAFVCGGYRWPTQSNEMLLARRLDGGEWMPLAIPPFVLRPGKLIDALVIEGDRLIAIDDKVAPKWFLEYNAQNPEKARLVQTHEFQHEPNEIAHAATLGTRFIAVRSTAFSDGHFACFVRLYDRHTFIECGYVQAEHAMTRGTFREVSDPLGRQTMISNHEWHDLAFLGDTLLIAGGYDGLGILETAAVKSLTPVGPQQRKPPPAYLTEQLRFEPPVSGLETVAVVPVPAFRGAFVVEASGTERTVRWHAVGREDDDTR